MAYHNQLQGKKHKLMILISLLSRSYALMPTDTDLDMAVGFITDF